MATVLEDPNLARLRKTLLSAVQVDVEEGKLRFALAEMVAEGAPSFVWDFAERLLDYIELPELKEALRVFVDCEVAEGD